MICRKHPHSSESSARRCAEQAAGHRADKWLKMVMFGEPYKYRQKKHSPPTRITVNTVTYFVFFSGR